MNGISRYTDAVEAVKAKNKEEAELRLARIANNKEPSHQNGHPKHAEKTGSSMPGGTRRSKRSA
jgi:hypothetical protein